MYLSVLTMCLALWEIKVCPYFRTAWKISQKGELFKEVLELIINQNESIQREKPSAKGVE